MYGLAIANFTRVRSTYCLPSLVKFLGNTSNVTRRVVFRHGNLGGIKLAALVELLQRLLDFAANAIVEVQSLSYLGERRPKICVDVVLGNSSQQRLQILSTELELVQVSLLRDIQTIFTVQELEVC